MKKVALSLLAVTCFASPVLATHIQTVFVVAMENHNFTQPTGLNTSPEQILGNPAATYINSLITPGNANAQYVSYFSNMTNVGTGIHPSEPNYIWQNGGSKFCCQAARDPNAPPNDIL